MYVSVACFYLRHDQGGGVGGKCARNVVAPLRTPETAVHGGQDRAMRALASEHVAASGGGCS